MTQHFFKPTPPVPRDANGEIIHNGALATCQRYEAYTEENHLVWKTLYHTQKANLEKIAYSKWLKAVDTIGLTEDAIPNLSDIAHNLYPLTGWQPVPISGFLDAKDYFAYLAQRRFPTVASIRTMDRLEFIAEPDIFHDAFGHLPMHSHPTFADFLQLYGKTALQADTPERMRQMQRLYWFTVEYGMIKEGGIIKVAGSGHMSGIKEAQYSLTDEVEKIPFDLDRVIAQDFNPHILQKTLFVLESYDQLYEAMQEMAGRLAQTARL